MATTGSPSLARTACPRFTSAGASRRFFARPRIAATLLHPLAAAIEAAFWLVAASMVVSAVILVICGEETHPALNPAKA
ncbi:hypothetical protein OAR16_00020 [bacterium]|nr:hypothetical protein [bacterium]